MTGEVIALEGSIGREAGDDAERLAALFDAHHRRLFALACRMCRTREDARDCVQETFLRAARRPELLPQDGGSEEAWLVRVLINICRDGWRRQVVRQAVPVDPSPSSPDQEASLIAR